jgi:hypothetical protein
LTGAVGAGALTLGTPWLATASAATDDDLAFAYFGVSAELLLAEFYAKAIRAGVVTGSELAAIKRGRKAALQHAKALSDLLTGAGGTPPDPADFEFVWPKDAFTDPKATVETGLSILRSAAGAYQSGAAAATEQTYRVLYVSLAASAAQQIGALAAIARRQGVEPFPAAIELEAASNALENYLG